LANAGKSFNGSKVYGTGFIFDDTDTKGIATPLAEMRTLIDKSACNQEVIFPYIGGEEINTSPTQAHHRFVINFADRAEEECRRRWPDLMAIVEAKVKPERMENKRDVRRKYWWHFGERTPALYAATGGLEQVLAISCVGQHGAFVFLPGNIVYSHALMIFPLSTYSAFCALQSRPHEIWARFFGSSMKDDLRYTPSDCFETFPFPENRETLPGLEAVGMAYYAFRAALMVRNNEGITATYNRFHDPNEDNPDILRLRELHARMDRAVLDSYGWTDIQPSCEFLLDYEEEEDDDDNGQRRRKKPWRYRWPDEIHDEVLARLLELNRQRALAEGQVLAAVPIEAESSAASPKRKNSGVKRKGAVSKSSMFPEPKGVS
jgi:hypothetical protein